MTVSSLQALQIFARRRQPTLVFTSVLLHPATDSSTVDNGALVRCLSRFLGSKLLRSMWKLTQQYGDKIVFWLKLKTSLHTILLETKYGLRLDLSDRGTFKLTNISFLRSVHELRSLERLATVENRKTPRTYRYRLSPDWQSSYLWDDSCEKYTLTSEENISTSVIECRYPVLGSFYQAWLKSYNTAFEQRKCDLCSGADVFSDLHERVAWETEGFLMACWLGLQDSVEVVEYAPSQLYRIEKGGMELHRFLGDMEGRVSCR